MFLPQGHTARRALAQKPYADYLRHNGDYAAATEAYGRVRRSRGASDPRLLARLRAARSAVRAIARAGPVSIRDARSPARPRPGMAPRRARHLEERVEHEPARELAEVQGALEVLRLCDDLEVIRDPEPWHACPSVAGPNGRRSGPTSPSCGGGASGIGES